MRDTPLWTNHNNTILLLVMEKVKQVSCESAVHQGCVNNDVIAGVWCTIVRVRSVPLWLSSVNGGR